MATLRVEMLGRFCITYRGNTVTAINTNRLQALLAYLILNGRGAQPREHLAFLFWPDSTESQARTNLRQLLHHLRSGLPDSKNYIEIDHHALRWRTESDFSSDVGEFEQALSTQAWEGEISDIHRERLESAARLYRGDLLPGFYEEWVEQERRLLRQRYTGALIRLIAHLEKIGEYPVAIAHGERLLSCDPLSEATYQTLMRLHALNGDRAGALRAYHQCAAVLRRELNVEPGISTQRLCEQLASPGQAPAEGRAADPRSLTSTLPFVGRRKELDRILELWRAVAGGRALFALILGESGIGKTRLTEEAMSRAGQDASAVYARCYMAERHLAYAPVTRWLRSEPIRSWVAKLPESELSELVRVVPELLKDRPGLSPPQPLAEAWHRRRFLETLARAILSPPPPHFLVIDDLQWCDPETLEWLEFLMHYDPGARILVLGAARVEEVGDKHALRPFLNRLIGDDLASEVVLSPLDKEETAALARHVSRHSLETHSLECIYRDTEGNPLFVVEGMRAGLATFHELQTGNAGGGATSAPLPPKVRAMLASRLAQLSPLAHDVAGLAATIGRSFSFELLLKAGTLGEADLIRIIDELWQSRIIHHAGNGLYDFSHDKLREVAYEELGPARKGSWHRSLAAALESAPSKEEAAIPQLAGHYERAGMPARAIPLYVAAAKSSRTRYADKEAIEYFTNALQLLEAQPQTRGRDEQELEVLILLGPAVVSTRGYAAPEAGRVYDRARLLCEFLNARDAYFPVLWGSWVFHFVRSNFQAALEFAARFRQLADGCGNMTLEAAGRFIMGCTLFHMGKAAQAREHFVEALKCYDPLHFPFLLHEYGPELGVFCQSYLAHALWFLGNPGQSLDESSGALTRARELGDPFSIVIALVYASMLHQFLGDRDRSRRLAEEASALCDEYGFGYYRAWPPIMRGWAMAESGQALEGAGIIQGGLDSLRQIQSRLREPYYLGLLAQACSGAGQGELALQHIRNAFAIIEKSGETWTEAEINRIKGDLLLREGDSRGAELSYQRALSVAAQQEAGSLAVRAAVSLGRLWKMQGKQNQLQKLARELHGRNSGRADAPDLTEMDSLLGGRVPAEKPGGAIPAASRKRP